MSNPIKKLAGQTAIYGLSSVIGRFLNYLLVPLYTSELVFKDPRDYGVVSELYAWVAFLMVFLTMGMETAYFKFSSEGKNKKAIFQNALWSVIGINFVFLLFVVFFYQSIAEKLLYGDNPEYILLLGCIIIIDAVSALPLAKLRAEQKAKQFAIIQLTSIGVNIGLNLFLLLVIFDTNNPEQGVRFILIANIVASLVKPLALISDFKQLRFNINFGLIQQMLKYSFPLAIAGLAFIVNETIDRILLKPLTYKANVDELGEVLALGDATAQVGIYSASYKLALLVSIFLQAYRYAAEPFFFAQAKDENRNKVYVKVMNYFVGFLFLCFLGVSLNIDVFKYFIPNQNYWEGLKVVPILLLANVFLGIYLNQSMWYKLSGQTKYGAYIAVGGAIFTLVANILLIPSYGYIACAWVTLGAYFGQLVASYYFGKKHYHIPYNIRKFFLYAGLAILLFFITKWMALTEGWLQLFIHNAFIALYLLFFLWLEKPFKKQYE